MSISTIRTIAQLKEQCEDLGIKVVQSGKRISKTDYVLALRDYFLKLKYPNGVPESLSAILQIESPMLCQRMNVLSEEEQENIWNSENWVLEEKEDGARFINIWGMGKPDFYSRNISVEDFLPVNYQDNVYLPNVDLTKIKDKFILDSEIVSTNPNVSTIMGKKGVITESQLQAVTALLAMNSEDSIAIQAKEDCPLQFKIFDCLYFNGEWLIDKPLIERIPFMMKAFDQLVEAGVNVARPRSAYQNKKAFYKTIISMGGEGCIAKNLFSPYIASNSRSRHGFVKIKRTMSETSNMLGIGDTIDAFVTGFEPADENKSWAGLVGALEFSVLLRNFNGDIKQHKIARISAIPMDLREQMTEVVDGKVTLKSEWYGKVASIDGQCISARSHRLKHAVLSDWRPDRSAETCIMDEDFMLSMVL